MEIRVIGDRDTVTGFRLAGAFAFHVESTEEAAEALARCVQEPEVGLIIIAQYWAERLDDRLRELRRRHTLPLIITIPSRYDPARLTSAAQRARQLIGLGPAAERGRQ